jgi:hypothetical protein
MVPVFNVVAFCFSAQYIVPEMARGFADKPEKLPKAIMPSALPQEMVATSEIFSRPLSEITDSGTSASRVKAVCAVRDADFLLGTGRQLPDQYLRSVPPGE